MSPPLRFDGGSFKDPSGRVFLHDGRVFRRLNAAGRAQFDALTASGLYEELHEAGRLVGAAPCDPAAAGIPETDGSALLLEHERIPFITYSYEWSFEMLRDAALLTLDILKAALAKEFILKDATPFNVQFAGGAPVFIDVLSLEPYAGKEPWYGYAQFCSTFLYPLMLTAYRGIDFQSLLRGTLGTIDVVDMSRLFGMRDVLKPGVLTHVKLAARLQRSFEGSSDRLTSRFRDVGFSKEMILANVRGLRRTIEKLPYSEAGSAWADYATSHSYTDADHERKAAFVRAALDDLQPKWVWDLGCNVGEYSQLAADAGARVLSVDGDAAAIDRLYRLQKAGERSPHIQPLVGDLVNPSPGLGWALAERGSWWDRGAANGFLALALVHHLAISGNVPLPEVVRFLADVAPAGVVEFVEKADPMVQRLLATRQDVFGEYTLDAFRGSLLEHFRIVREERSESGTRVLFQVAPAA